MVSTNYFIAFFECLLRYMTREICIGLHNDRAWASSAAATYAPKSGVDIVEL